MKVAQVAPTDLSTVQFDKYDAVFIANVTDFRDETLRAMEQYLRRGGGLVFFPGSNTQAGFYNDHLFKKNRILPAALGDAYGQADQDEKYFTLDDKKLDHAVAAVFKDAGRPSVARFYRAYELKVDGSEKPDETIGAPRVVLRFADTAAAGPLAGQPAVMERTWGLGRVVEFASTADTDWTNLPAWAGVWVPLMQRTLGMIVQRQDESLNLRVGQRFVYHAPAEMLNKDAQMIEPPGGAGEPVRELRRVEMLKGSPALTFENTDLSGGYEVSFAGDPPMVMRFAAQPDNSESELSRLNDAQLKNLEPVGTVVKWPPTESLEATLDRQRVGTELWLWFAVPALALAVIETLLGHWFSKPK